MKTLKGMVTYFVITLGFIWYSCIVKEYPLIANLLVSLPIYFVISHLCYEYFNKEPYRKIWTRDRKYIVFYTAQSRIEGSKARGMCLVTHKGKITSPNDLREVAAKLDIESEDLTNHTITNYKLV